MGNTILIVEDDARRRKSLAKYFSCSGFTVYSAGNCREAIELAFRHLPDCVLWNLSPAPKLLEKGSSIILRSWEAPINDSVFRQVDHAHIGN